MKHSLPSPVKDPQALRNELHSSCKGRWDRLAGPDHRARVRAATLRPGPGLAAGTDGGSGAILAVPSPGGGSRGRSRRPPPRWRPRSPLRPHPAFRRTPNPLTTPLPNTAVFLGQMTLGWPSPAPAHRWRPPSLSAAAAPRPRRGGWPQEGALAAGRGAGGGRWLASWPLRRAVSSSLRGLVPWAQVPPRQGEDQD